MIKTRTPYYINIPFVSPTTSITCYGYTLKISIWQGLKVDAPAEPNYQITKYNPEGLTTTDKVNIAQLLKPFIDFQFQNSGTGLIDGVNQIWVKSDVVYQQTSEAVYETPITLSWDLAINGYAGGMDGENASTPTDKVLMRGREFKVNRGGRFIIPIEIDEPTPPTPEIVITNLTDDGGDEYTFTYTTVGTYNSLSFVLGNGSIYTIPVESTDVTSPTTITNTASGLIEGYILGFDIATGTSITSNTFTI